MKISRESMMKLKKAILTSAEDRVFETSSVYKADYTVEFYDSENEYMDDFFEDTLQGFELDYEVKFTANEEIGLYDLCFDNGQKVVHILGYFDKNLLKCIEDLGL